jgi:hypothetical protein
VLKQEYAALLRPASAKRQRAKPQTAYTPSRVYDAVQLTAEVHGWIDAVIAKGGPDGSPLDADQARCVAAVLVNFEARRAGKSPKPLRALLTGEAGTGKSEVINTILSYIRKREADDDEDFDDAVKVTSPSARAAQHIGACTLHSAVGTLTRKTMQKTPWQNKRLWIHDECFMTGLKMLGRCRKMLAAVCGEGDSTLHTDEFDVDILFAGDIYQLPAVKDQPMFRGEFMREKQPNHREVDAKDEAAQDFYRTFDTVFELRTNYRVQQGPSQAVWLDAQRLARYGYRYEEVHDGKGSTELKEISPAERPGVLAAQTALLNRLVLGQPGHRRDDDRVVRAEFGAKHRALTHPVGLEIALRAAGGATVYRYTAADTVHGGAAHGKRLDSVSTWLDGWVGQNYSKDNMRCPREFLYFAGMRYYFPKNDADFKQHSIVNGGACVGRRLVLDPREPPLVKQDGIVDLEYAPLLVVVEPEKKPGHGAKAISLDLPAEEDGGGADGETARSVPRDGIVVPAFGSATTVPLGAG